jgi:hypothetical protein
MSRETIFYYAQSKKFLSTIPTPTKQRCICLATAYLKFHESGSSVASRTVRKTANPDRYFFKNIFR